MKNAFANFVFPIIFALLFSLNFQAQTSCVISERNAPILLNLRTGMQPEEVQAIFGKALKIKVKKNGERILFQNYIKKPAPPELKNVRALYLRFFDKKLYQIEIFYEPRINLPNAETAAKTLSSELDFPFENWKIKHGYAETVCGEISLKADSILNPHIEMTDEIMLKRVMEAREKSKK